MAGSITPTPFPHFVAHNAVEAQEIQILNQIQNHTITPRDLYLFTLAHSLPLPSSWKFALYNFLLHSSFPHISVGQFLLLLFLGGIINLLLIYLVIRYSIPTISFLASLFVSGVTKQKPEKKIFLQLIFPADTSKSAYATEQVYMLLHSLARQKTLKEKIGRVKHTYALEIVATKKDGIRYIIAVPSKDTDVITRSILSYLPGIRVTEVSDYLSEVEEGSVTELTLSGHMALPLKDQTVLSQHDLIGYITGNMTQLQADELIAFQLVTTPVTSTMHMHLSRELQILQSHIYHQMPLADKIRRDGLTTFLSLPVISFFWFLITLLLAALKYLCLFLLHIIPLTLDSSGKSAPILMAPQISLPETIGNPYEQELHHIVKEKIDQPLFETAIRIFIKTDNTREKEKRLSGLLASFGPLSTTYQSLIPTTSVFHLPFVTNPLTHFINRTLSHTTPFTPSPILSSREMADLYHFPYTHTTKTEDMVKVMSPELPMPLSIKNNHDLDVTFGTNTYGNIPTPIGLTDDERSRHVYLLGQTGSGKSTVMFHMAKDDIQKGRGVCVIDPHGDLVEDLLSIVPEARINDVVYINPFDIKHPISINLLELTKTKDQDQQELEKELVAESIVSIFRRLFAQDEHVDAHRIEYILRNTIYTAFYVKDATIFTIYKLLTNPDYRRKITQAIDHPELVDFWKHEFGKAGNYQVFKMISGVTAKVGRFLFSPIARRMLEKPRSTIQFDRLLNEGKIILCNLSEGKIGEDTSHLIGTTIITKIHQAIVGRAQMERALRTPFYLSVDEFQNFATSSFTKLLSGGRKFGLRVTIAEQSTAQQQDTNITNVMLANVGTVICFRTASPVDEEIMLSQFYPLITKSAIGNLPRFHFYIKLGAKDPQEPFSGKTFPIPHVQNPSTIATMIAASQTNYASVYHKTDVPPRREKTQKKEPKQGKNIQELT